MERMRRFISILLIACVFLTACGGEKAVKTEQHIMYSKDGKILMNVTAKYNRDGYALFFPQPVYGFDLIFEYDKNNRPLVEIVKGETINQSYAYEYDEHGNMTEYKFCGDDSGVYETRFTMEYEYNENDEVTSVRLYDHEKTLIERYEVSYEDSDGIRLALYKVYNSEGNMIHEGKRLYTGFFDVKEPGIPVDYYRFKRQEFDGVECEEKYAIDGSLSWVRYEYPYKDVVIKYTYY